MIEINRHKRIYFGAEGWDRWFSIHIRKPYKDCWGKRKFYWDKAHIYHIDLDVNEKINIDNALKSYDLKRKRLINDRRMQRKWINDTRVPSKWSNSA